MEALGASNWRPEKIAVTAASEAARTAIIGCTSSNRGQFAPLRFQTNSAMGMAAAKGTGQLKEATANSIETTVRLKAATAANLRRDSGLFAADVG